MKHLFVLFIFILFTACTSPKVSNTQEQKDLVTETTSNFYSHYVVHLQSANQPSMIEYLYAQKEIAHSLVQKIEHMQEEEAKQDKIRGFTLGGGDPILLAQDIPAKFKYSVPLIKGAYATINVFGDYGGGYDNTDSIQIKLKKIDKTWKIIKITDIRARQN